MGDEVRLMQHPLEKLALWRASEYDTFTTNASLNTKGATQSWPLQL